ncbi:hypothetical protein Bsp3421_004790 [Burkholderia sp. FERM BP-3421]|uniref:gp53-like domain-containing protein n=1 Tax=Burkholderia sp. FERM BP-3421 TaxID=1494466 RepID=UPI00235E821F|nr:hypothetical protein [Burkholderia sp. FERM BP-3421]WDD94656.1 hypothetical protein Bsp3421_004790 [Burkholderia sp. FERM BP-3421]
MSNDFLPFAVGGAANVETQSDYVADATTRQTGFQSGVANSAKLNKVWRQSSIMAAVLGQFAADYSGNNSTDDGTTTTLEANLVAAIRNATKTGVILADTGAANAYAAVNAPPLIAGTWVDGVVQQIRIAHANTGASTYAPDGLTAIPIYGLGLQPLQSGELVLNGIAILVRMTIPGVNSGNPIAVLMECAGGAQQVAPATASQHAIQLGQATNTSSPLALATLAATVANQAVNLGQFSSSQAANGYFKLPNGVIIQWCIGTTSGGGATLTYPIAFPNGVLAAVPIFYAASGAANSLAINTPSKTAALVNAVNSSGSGVSGITVGCIVIGN